MFAARDNRLGEFADLGCVPKDSNPYLTVVSLTHGVCPPHPDPSECSSERQKKAGDHVKILAASAERVFACACR